MKKNILLILSFTFWLHAMERQQPMPPVFIQIPYGYQLPPPPPQETQEEQEEVDPKQAQSVEDLLALVQKADAAVDKSKKVQGNATRLLTWKQEYQQLFDELPQEYNALNQLIQASSSIDLKHPIVLFLLHKKISQPRKEKPQQKAKISLFKKQEAENPELSLTSSVSDEQLDSLASEAAEQYGFILPQGELPLLVWENKKLPEENRRRTYSTLTSGQKEIMVIKYLEIKKAASITSLPFLPGIEAITMLNLGNIQLEILPDSIGLLTSLEALRLKNNKLKDLPQTLTQLKKLKILNIGCNRFEELPTHVGAFAHLQALFVYYNKLKEVSQPLTLLTQLQILDLENNQLQNFPEWLPQTLEYLELQHNKITKIPVSIGQLTQLKEFIISENPLTEIPYKEVFSLKSLEAVKFEKGRVLLLKEAKK